MLPSRSKAVKPSADALSFRVGTKVEVQLGSEWLGGVIAEVRNVPLGFCPLVVRTANGSLLHAKVTDVRLASVGDA